MPSFGNNKNVMCYINDIYVYLRARGNGDLDRARPEKHTPKPKVYADAETAGNSPVDLEAGELREIRKTNPDTGGMYREFKGSRTFVASMSPAPRYLSAFNARQSA